MFDSGVSLLKQPKLKGAAINMHIISTKNVLFGIKYGAFLNYDANFVPDKMLFCPFALFAPLQKKVQIIRHKGASTKRKYNNFSK